MERKRKSKEDYDQYRVIKRRKQPPQHAASSQATGPSETDMQRAGPSKTDNQAVRDYSSTAPGANEFDLDSADVDKSRCLKENKKLTPIPSSQGKMTMLSEQRKQILTEKRVKLIECIKLNGLWAHLRSHKIVTEQDEKRIKLNKTSHEQIGELLDHLAKGTERDFEAFCYCLKEDNQEHVVAEILRYSAPSPSNQDFLTRKKRSRDGKCGFKIAIEPQSPTRKLGFAVFT
ncbi:hypothetical protein CAPTEDRAFT_194696 [Capitella teleta]|uniref:CARD domain-containing protein n=1 Tax=Capitella teleta TaxID=283909 RepID=R7V1P0_CAPTE|nr:hypothetical protein CAPTEDRAFT_194696 [Capitella teleta]|eukprot:ELU09576.1 hypothetical protein CAPTEDRAFT_194696 [Capitella teleta]